MSGCGATDQPAHQVPDLIDHIAAAPTRSAHMLRGEPVDCFAPPPPAGEDPAATFRAGYPMVGTLSRR